MNVVHPTFGLSLRQPPSNLEAEQALLGALLANGKAYDRVAEFLRPEHFADATHGEIYRAIVQEIERLRADAGRAFADFDMILTPACAAQPWPRGETHPAIIDDRPVGPRGHAVYTGWVNAIGHPALAAPCGHDSQGLPVGLQLVGDLGAEPLLLAMAGRCERLFGLDRGRHAWPAIARG